MKNKIILYIIVLLLLFVLLYAINSKQEKTFKWIPSYDQYDKHPFGAYVFDQLLEKSWKEPYTHSYQNIQRLIRENASSDQHLLVVANDFYSEEGEIEKMLEYAGEGHKILIACSEFDVLLRDTLGFSLSNDNPFGWYFISNHQDTLTQSRKLRLCAPVFRAKQYTFPQILCSSYFDTVPENARIIAVNNSNKAVAFTCPVGKGECIVCCTPMLFTNYGILSDGHEFIWGLLSYLQGAPLMRTEYYEMGSNESDSPFRYLLSEPALRWALYISLATLLILLVFTARRKQRVIPVIEAPENHLLKFVRSVAALYLKKGDNADILQKKYTLFAEQLQKGTGIDIINRPHNSVLLEQMAQKTGSSPDEIRDLFNGLELIHSQFKLNDRTLMELVIKMDNITKKLSN